MKIKDKLSIRRKELGLTMLEIANKVGVSEATVSRWESGQITSLKQDKIELLAQILNVPVSYLVVEDEPLVNVQKATLHSNVDTIIIPPNSNIVSITKHTGESDKYILNDEQTNVVESMIKQMPKAEPFPISSAKRARPVSQVAYGGKSNKSVRKNKRNTTIK